MPTDELSPVAVVAVVSEYIDDFYREGSAAVDKSGRRRKSAVRLLQFVALSGVF